MPPKIAIKTGRKEKSGSKALYGSTYVHLMAMMAPAMPMKKALMANMSYFYRGYINAHMGGGFFILPDALQRQPVLGMPD